MSTCKIKTSVRKFLSYSLAEVEAFYRQCRISDRDYLTFRAIWTWSSPKLGGPAEIKHEQFWRRFGAEAYYRRINKVRAACGYAPLKCVPAAA